MDRRSFVSWAGAALALLGIKKRPPLPATEVWPVDADGNRELVDVLTTGRVSGTVVMGGDTLWYRPDGRVFLVRGKA